MLRSSVQPGQYVALRLPSGNHMITEIKYNTTIQIGKFGSFQSNDLIGRPYHFTYEIIDRKEVEATGAPIGLRIITPDELNAEIQAEEDSSTAEDGDETRPVTTQIKDGVQYDIIGEKGELLMRTNRRIIDSTSNQSLTKEEIEVLKNSGSGSGKELIAKLLESHGSLDQKTSFSLAKYTLRKTKKFSKRFTVLPLTVACLARWMFYEKDIAKIMEMREEALALIGSWSNVHYSSAPTPALVCSNGVNHSAPQALGIGRWLVVDDTGGLLVAYMAEKMGLLHPDTSKAAETPSTPQAQSDTDHPMSNTLTLLHSASQPNLSLLRYFSFDSTNPPPSHPLTTHLRGLTWLQFLQPDKDTSCIEPTQASPETLASMKSSRRSTYYRKRRRWARLDATIKDTRAGCFDGLVIASVMHPESVLNHLVPLLKGGSPVVVYSKYLEPLAELSDYYSTARKSAYVMAASSISLTDEKLHPTKDYPVDPRLLLAPTIHTVKARPWQVLPGRTHPLMTGKGGAEGFVFTGIRVLPLEGVVQARGKRPAKKAKVVPVWEGPVEVTETTH